jgi:hypothetical protein
VDVSSRVLPPHHTIVPDTHGPMGSVDAADGPRRMEMRIWLLLAAQRYVDALALRLRATLWYGHIAAQLSATGGPAAVWASGWQRLAGDSEVASVWLIAHYTRPSSVGRAALVHHFLRHALLSPPTLQRDALLSSPCCRELIPQHFSPFNLMCLIEQELTASAVSASSGSSGSNTSLRSPPPSPMPLSVLGLGRDMSKSALRQEAQRVAALLGLPGAYPPAVTSSVLEPSLPLQHTGAPAEAPVGVVKAQLLRLALMAP